MEQNITEWVFENILVVINYNLLIWRDSNSDCESSKNSEITPNGRESIIDLTNESRINLSDISPSDFDDDDYETVSQHFSLLYL